MEPHVAIRLGVGSLLIVASLILAIYASATGRKVQTWTPFVWSALLGVLIVPGSFVLEEIDLSRPFDSGNLVLDGIGAVLILGSLGISMFLSLQRRKVETWTPMVWGTILGLLLL